MISELRSSRCATLTLQVESRTRERLDARPKARHDEESERKNARARNGEWSRSQVGDGAAKLVLCLTAGGGGDAVERVGWIAEAYEKNPSRLPQRDRFSGKRASEERCVPLCKAR